MSKHNKQVSKYFLNLYNKYDRYINEKKEYLNYKRIVDYLYNKPIQKIYTLNELIKPNKNASSLKIVRLELSNDKKIEGHFFTLNSLYQMYCNTMKNIKKRVNVTKINKTNLRVEISKNEKKIMKYLGDIAKKYKGKIEYTYNWNFNVVGENNLSIKIATVNNQDKYNYNFYGVIMFRYHLIQFVIVYDDETHFDQTNEKFRSVHRRDIINQYMLFQMNVNLLRLNENMLESEDYKLEIKNFINKIKHTTEYVIHNGITPITGLFQSTEINNTLKNFCYDYEYNHNMVYHKLPKKKHYKYETNDDKFYEHLTMKDIYVDEAQDNGKKIAKEIIGKVMKNGRTYKPQETGNKKRAEEYLVKILGAQEEVELNKKETKKIIMDIMNEFEYKEEDDVELIEEISSEEDNVQILLKGFKNNKKIEDT